MLDAIAPATSAAVFALACCLLLVLVFEFSNGFHDTANAVATVIYTRSLDPVPAVIWSAALNFAGVMLGGVAVAFTLVELIPPDTLTPPDGNPAIAVLLSLFVSTLAWNIGTWYLGIPCSSSHAVIGSIIGVALANSLTSHRGMGAGVDWGQIKSVGMALLVSPLIGFILAGVLFRLAQLFLRDKRLFEAPKDGKKPTLWVRCLLILTCGGVSFAHGSNDGQKSIGLIMLTVIGLMPLRYGLNPEFPPDRMPQAVALFEQAQGLIDRHGDDQKAIGSRSAKDLADLLKNAKSMSDVPDDQRRSVRGDIYRVDTELKYVAASKYASADERRSAEDGRKILKASVEYAPWWARILSALCLGLGTMIGYQRVVRTIGERIGKKEMTPAQGGSAELVGAALILTAGMHGLPVSTTHIVSSGIAGTMVGAGAGIQPRTLWSIALAWILTLPVTVLLSGGLFYLLG